MPPSVGTIVCPACAAAVPKNASACPYCGSVVVLPPPKGADGPAETRTFCPRCGDQYPTAAAKCPRCPPGATDERGGRCPRCAGDLEPTPVGNVTVDRCRACRGTWFDGDELEHVVNLTTRGISREEASSRRRSLPNLPPEDAVRYLACVRCGERMARRQVAPRTGLVIDICRAHGVWFDAGELEAFEKWVRAGGLEVVRHDGIAAVEAKRNERTRETRALDFRASAGERVFDDADSALLGFQIVRAVSRLFRHLPF